VQTEITAPLLVGAGKLIWRSGPASKGPGLCHGTAGNGYAFLKLFRRTGDQLWLDRARCFAMHAIEQHRRDTVKYGQRRYPLWTGDPGLAIYLLNCLAGTDRFPTMDNFFEP
jgi:Lanthionine synthetase C-like protein